MLSKWTARWRASGEPRIAIALLHSRVRFIGEFLAETVTPQTPGAVLAIANERYGLGWTTQAQVDRRRGWLQSAGLLELNESRQLVATALGRAFAEEIGLHQPDETSILPETDEPRSESTTILEDAEASPDATNALNQLITEIRQSSTASGDPDRFERAIREAFAILGYEAQWLGGSGRTDVLLDAPIGRHASYRVIVDCKTSGGAGVADQQVDWITLQEHKSRHSAEYVAVVGPTPHGSRLFERASQQAVTVISVDQIAGLLQQHMTAPLGLTEYRKLFSGGPLEPAATADDAEEWLRLVQLADAVMRAITARTQQFGALSARDLLLVLADEPMADATTEHELQIILNTLASPLLQVLVGDSASGYRPSTTPGVIGHRLRLLAERFGSGELRL